MLDIDQRKMYLQEAKLQPKVKCIVYKTTGNDKNISPQQDANEQDMVRELSRTNRKIEKSKTITNGDKRANGKHKVEALQDIL